MLARHVHLSLRYPGTWAAAALVAAWALWAITRYDPPPATVGAIITLAVLMLAAWFVIFALLGLLAGRRASTALREEQFHREQALGTALEKLSFERGKTQLHSLRNAFDSLMSVIQLRFSAGELAFGRYSKAAQTVHEASVQNLEEVRVALESVSAVRPADIEKQRGSPDSPDGAAPSDATDSPLLTRLALREHQEQRIETLLAANEAVLTAITNTASALASTQTGSRATPVAARAAITQLERLAQGASRYAVRAGAGSGSEDDHSDRR